MRMVPLMVVILASSPAAAEVVSAGDHGFEVQQTVNLVVPQQAAYDAFSHIGSWWDKEHTYSGDASRMTLRLAPGGCFCETTDKGGGVEHMHVTYVQPGDRIVMTGSLGPTLYLATTGVMDIKFERIAGGTKVTMNYRVGGFYKGGAATIAPAVDQVLALQMKRYRTFAAAGGERPKLGSR